MQVIVEVLTGGSQGRKMSLKAHQKLRVGRTSWADFIIDADEKMSSVHFAIVCHDNHVTVLDLDSTNGTLLNGDYVKEAELRDGDTIDAGHTEFGIKIAGLLNEGPRTTVFDSGRLPDAESGIVLGFTSFVCESGLTLMRGGVWGEDNQPQEPAQLTKLLGHRYGQLLIADFKKAGQEAPEELADPVPLFDWLPLEVALKNSPLILRPDPAFAFEELVNELWDADALVCFYAEQDRDQNELIGHLRRATRFNMRGVVQGEASDEPKGLLGYCWPGVLSQLLEFRSSEFAQNLLGDFTAVLTEVPDLPMTWHLFGRDDLPGSLQGFGFVEIEEESKMDE